MVAVVTGTGVGLAGSSAAVLGAGGQLGNAATGRGGEAVSVNAQTGALVVQHEDELLAGQGPDIGVVRTYNSNATFDFDNNDGWQLSLYKKLGSLSGTANTAGSTIVRTGADGAQLTYTYDATRSAYVNKNGAGAYNTLSYHSSSNTWTWTDGDTRITETYAVSSTSGEWRISGQADPDGNALTYAYDSAGLITTVTDANNETTHLTYNAARQLQSIQVTTAGGLTTTRVRYTYDPAGRLASVVTDLTPADGSIADNKIYTTTYTYDGTSTRIASITHSDGTSVSFTYDANARVKTVTDGLGQTTTFTYGTNSTTVADPLGQTSTLTYDAAGNLTRLQGPAGSGQDVAYVYNANGDLTQLTDSRGNAVVYDYDSHGNCLRQQDAAGNVVARAYNSADQLTQETVYTVPDPDGTAGPGQASGAQTTYYVRDAHQHLRFIVSPEGRVSETGYNSLGQAIANLVYTATFTPGTSAPSEADLVTWSGTQDKTRIQRTDTAYDARGLINTVTRYAATDATGAGIADGKQSVTQYTYDSAGRLLQQIDPRGVATAATNDYLTSYTYDGLGRQTKITTTDAAGVARETSLTFTDAAHSTELMLANGLKRVSTYDARGLLTSQIEQNGATQLSTQTYQYDADGRLRIVTDPVGNKTYTLYDSAGRVVGVIDAAGALTETVYNANGQVTKTLRYANAVTANLATLFAPNANGVIPNVALASVRPTSSTANDQVERRLYDAAGRLRFVIDARSTMTETRYDGAGRIVATISYAAYVSNVSRLDTLGREAIASDISLVAGAYPNSSQTGVMVSTSADRLTRYFYDADGRLTGMLDSGGYATGYFYDGAGRLTQTIRYASATAVADRAAGTWAALVAKANLTPTNNIVSYTWYNGLGQVIGELDGENYYTAYAYDLAGNGTRTTRYAKRLVGTAAAGTPPQALATAPGTMPAGGYVLTDPQDQSAQASWTAANQLDTQTANDGTLTRYTYDKTGNLLSTVTAAGAADSRTLTQRYDLQGRLTQVLSAVGAQALAALGANPTPAQVDAVWAAYGTTYTYDAAGRRTKQVDAAGNVTLYFYDADHRLTYTVVRVKNPANANEWVGEVRARQFNALGQVTAEIGYATRLTATAFATLSGGADTQIKAAGILVADASRDTRTDYTYSLRGELTRSTVKLNATESAVTDFAPNVFGDLGSRNTKLDASRTRQEVLSYNTLGLLTQDIEDNVSGVTTKTGYDAFGRAISFTDGNGVIRTMTYDKLGRQIKTVAASGTGNLNLTDSSTYDAFGRVIKQSDALNPSLTTNYAYSIDTATGRTTLTVTSPENIVTKTVTDRYGQVVAVIDGRNNETRYTYDADGHLTSTKRWDAATGTETLVEQDSYNAVGQLSTVTAQGQTVSYTYDAAGRRLTRTVDPGGLNLVTTTAYDALGRSISVTDPAGTVTQTTYDQGGRIIEVALDPSGLNLVTRYSYNLVGEVLTVIEGAGTAAARTTAYTYDSLGRRTQTAVDPQGLNLVTTYAYDKNDNLVTRVEGAGTTLARTTRYSYDQANRLVYTVDSLGGIVKQDYDADGQVLQTTAYANAIAAADFASLATAPSVAAVTALVVADVTRDRTTRHVYDKDGRERFTIDALGGVTETQYDAAGNVTQRIAYANALQGTLTLGSAPALVTTAPGSGAYVLKSAQDAVTATTYDAFNRVTTQTDAVGTVTRFTYNSAGQLTDTTLAYGTSQAVTLHRVYDAAGRVTSETRAYNTTQAVTTTYSYDALGQVTDTTVAAGTAQAVTLHRVYDAAGRVTSETRAYNTTQAVTTTYSYDALSQLTDTTVAAGTAQAVTLHRVYDAAGRVTSETRAYNTTQAVTTTYSYDALSQLTDTTVAAGTAQAVTLHRVYDAAGQVLTETRAYNTAAAVTTRYGYDALGHQISITEADGTAAARTTTQKFDRVGRKTEVIDAAGAHTLTTYNAVGDIVSVTDALNRIGYFYTDALGRVTLQVDPEGAVTETRYDAFGHTTAVIRYANKVAGPLSTGTRPQILAAAGSGTYVVKSDTLDERQEADYDRLGQKTEIRTWWGTGATDYYRETFTYDLAGNVKTATARNGAVTTYTYDRLNHKTSEVLPITSRNASGVATAVENRYAYDAFGNLTQKTEAYGLPEQRITTTTYDALDRPVTQAGEALITFDPVSQTDVTVTPTTRKAYDLRGNLIEETDARGNRTLHYYDACDRETSRIDPAGTYTVWTYDAAGNKTSQTTYANAVAVSGTASLSAASAPLLLSAAPLAGNNVAYVVQDAANDRTVITTYDAVGRPTGTRIDDITTGIYHPEIGAGQYQISTGSLTTSTTYNLLGDVVKTTDADGHVTRTYYNNAGQQVGQLDAKGYLIVWTRDAYGNVTQETKYANAVAASLTVTDTTTLTTLQANVTASADDRITQYAYDRLNRVLTETHQSVAAGTVNATNGVLSESTQNAVTTYVYDGLDHVTRKTDANHAVTDWTYDGLGRQTREQRPGYTDAFNTAVRPTTDTEYDGLDQVKRSIERGTNEASEADDHITTYTYGVGGFLTSQTDANGYVTQYRVDANGNVTQKTLLNRKNADNVATNDVTRYQYDALNRQVKSTDVSTGTSQESRYNAFGEITGKRTNGGGADVAWPEFAQYDRAGRAWKSSSGDGVTKIYVYDAAGNATLTVQSTGTDLAGQELATVLARTDTLKTISVFDARNQLTDTFEPTMDAVHQVAAVQANSTGQAVYVTNNSAIVIGTDASLNNTTPTSSNPVSAGTVSATGAGISGSVTGIAEFGHFYKNNFYRCDPNNEFFGTFLDVGYRQSVSATITLPTALPSTGALRAELSITRPTYYRYPSDGFGNPPYSYSFGPGPSFISTPGWLCYGSPTTPAAYSAASVLIPQGSSQVTINAAASDLVIITGDQTYTLYLYQQTPYGDVLVGMQTGTVGTGSSVAVSMAATRRIAFQGQPTTATSLLLAYRAQGSTAPYTWAWVPALTNTGGTTIQGSFALDWNSLAGGNYEFQYYAIDAAGSVVNKQTGNLNLTNTAAPTVTQTNGALGQLGGAGRGVIDVNGNLAFTELGDTATRVEVKYRVKNSGSGWSSMTTTSRFSSAIVGWFYLYYPSYFGNNGTAYELDITSYAGSTVLKHSRAEFGWNGTNPTISAFTTYNEQPSIVHLTERTDTQYIEVSWRANNTSGAYTTLRVNPSSAGRFDWDASTLVPVASANYDYDVVIKAYDASGLLTNQTNAVLRLGANAAVLSAQNPPLPPLLRLTPAQTGVASVQLGYRLKNSNDAYTPLATTHVGSEFRADLNGVPGAVGHPTEYEYVCDAYNSNGVYLGRDTGNFTIGASTAPSRLDWVIQNVSAVSSRVHKSQVTNAFGEVVQEIDGLGRITNLNYNTLGLMVKKEDPETDVTLANGFVTRARPTTRLVYDLGGRLVAAIDPNGQTNTQVWRNGAEKDEIVLERHADGGLVTHAYDIFDNKRVDIDANAKRTETDYDALGHVVEVRHPVRTTGTQAIDRYTYDAAGQRITHTNALNAVEKTYYDSLGRVTQTRDYLGFATTYTTTYSNAILGVGGLKVGGWQTTTTDALGRTLIDQKDNFGRLTWHQDQGGHQFTYRYNGAGWLVSQTGTTGQNIVTDYYANGYVKSVWDQALGAYTRYEYDNAGNRTFEGYVSLKNPTDLNAGARDYYQYANLEYDELNRLKRVLDPKAEIKYEYDAAGNRRHMVSTYHDGVNGAMRVQDYWYQYDAMNRFTVTMGQLSTGARGTSATDTSVSIVRGSTGVAIEYNLGSQRTKATNGADGTVEKYTYSADGYLEDVSINDVLRSRRSEDLLGRVTGYTEWNAAGGQVYTRSTSYDLDNRVLSESSVDNSGAHSISSTTTNYYYTDATDNTATATQAGAGQLAHSATTSISDGATTTIHSYTAYDYWDGAQQMAVTAQAWNSQLKGNNKYWRPGYAYHVYDVNGHLAKAVDAGADGALGTADDRTLRYTNDAQGLVLVRDEIAGGLANRIERYYYANGVRVGDVGNDGPSRTDYAQAIATRGVDHKDYRHWQPVAAADFDQNYEPVGPAYPGMTPSSYTVRAGDTLQSIARAVWGDSAMWYLIADANGLSGTEALVAGQLLTIPNKVTNIHNNAGTFRPYNPGEAIGDTSPTIPTPPAPPKPKKGGCGGASILIAIVAVVATVFTAGAAAIAFAEAGSVLAGATGMAATWGAGLAVLGGTAVGTGIGMAGMMAAAAIGGAVGSIAGQLTGMALGVQDKFSWGAVAAGALASGVTSGIGGALGQGGIAGKLEIGSRYGAAAVNAAASNVIHQGIDMLTGQQKSFSWSSVAVSAISAPLAIAVSESVLGNYNGISYSGGAASSWASSNTALASLADTGLRAIVSATTRVAIVGGRLSWEAVAADTLSSFISSERTWSTPRVGGSAGGTGLSLNARTGLQPNAQDDLLLQPGEGIQVNLTGGGNTPIFYQSPDYTLDGAGMRLATQEGDRFSYIVQSRDTLTGVAQANGRRLGEVMAINRIQNPDQIRVGQTIDIPARGLVPPEVSDRLESQYYQWKAEQRQVAIQADRDRAAIASAATGGGGLCTPDNLLGLTQEQMTQTVLNSIRSQGPFINTMGALNTNGTVDSVSADQGYFSSVGSVLSSNLPLSSKFSMLWDTTKYYYRGSEEAQGLAQVTAGGLELLGAAALSGTGIGATLGVPLAFHAGDSIGTGWNRMVGRGDGKTVTYQATYELTGSAVVANGFDQGIPFLAGIAGLSSLVSTATRASYANYLSSLVANDAEEIISLGGGAGRAVSRFGSADWGLESPRYVNFLKDQVGKVPDFDGVTWLKGSDKFIISNSAEYMAAMKSIYEELDGGMHPITYSRILDRISGERVFDISAGLPGAHAEVRAQNWLLNQTGGVMPYDATAATYYLSGKNAGLPFVACSNCTQIVLPGVSVATGRRAH